MITHKMTFSKTDKEYREIVRCYQCKTFRNGEDDLFTRFNTYDNEHQKICRNCCSKTYNV